MIPIEPARDTAQAKAERAIQPIGAEQSESTASMPFHSRDRCPAVHAIRIRLARSELLLVS